MKHLKLFFALFAMLALGVGNAWAETATLSISSGVTANKTLTDDGGNSWSVTSDGSYTSNTKYIQVGTNKKNVTYLKLSTSAFSSKNISKIQVWATSKASTNVTAKVYIGGNLLGISSAYTTQNAADGGTEYSVANTNNYTGDILVEISRPTAATGAIYFNKAIVTYTEGGSTQPTLSSIEISGDLTTKTYEEGDELDLSGLIVQANYDSGDPKDVTNDVEWSYTPNPLTKGTTSVNVTATYTENSVEKTVTKTITGLTVNEHVVTSGTYGLLLNNVFFGTTAGTNVSSFPVSAKQDDITVTLNGSGTKTRTDAANVRMYSGNTLTFAVPAGYVIKSIVFTEPNSNKQWDGSITVNTGTYTDNTKTWTGSAQEVTYTFGAQNRIANAEITYEVAPVEPTKTLTSIEITTPATQTTFWQNETFNYDDLVVKAHYSDAEDEIITPTVTGNTATAGTATVTVSYKEQSTSYAITVKAIPNTKETAYSVADAYDIIDKLTTAEGVFISGIISQVDSYNSTYKSITYWISADGTTTKQLQVYSGKGLESADFSDKTDLSVGDQVIVCGNLKKYSGTYEFDKNNYLASHTPTTKDPAGLAYATTSYTANVGEPFTTPELTNPHNLAVTYSTSDPSKATVVANTGAVTIVAAGVVTITAATTGDASHDAGSASYTITISNPAMAVATLPFAFDNGEADIENTPGMSQDGLGSDYTSAGSPKLKFDHTGDCVIIHFNGEPGKLSYDIKGNSYSDGTFAVQESADGSAYTNIVEYTELGSTATKTHTLAATSRYVKFIYTEKVNGNVALGNIKIALPEEEPGEGGGETPEERLTDWVLTPLADITTNDLVVITMTKGETTWAMTNDKGTSAAPAAPVVTLSADALAAEPDANLKWVVSNDNGTLTIYPYGTYETWLYCTNTNNGVRVGTGVAKEFTINANYLYTSQTTDPRHIGVYNEQDWRCYKPSSGAIATNIADQTLAFYVKKNANDVLPGAGEDPEGGEGGETPVVPTINPTATFIFNTAEGLNDLGIAYPTTEDEDNVGAYKTNLTDGASFTQDGITMTSTDGTTVTRVWLTTAGKLDLRVYKNATLTFSVPAEHKISAIVFDGSNIGHLLVNGTAVSGNAWTGSEQTVTFTAKADASTIKINTIAFVVEYTRDVTNIYGTICLPYGSTNYAGATFYRVAGKETGKVYLESVSELEAGVPYIFEKTANQIKVVYTGEAVDAPQNGDANGLVGTFTEITVPDGDYILYNNAFCANNDPSNPNKIRAYRAYLDMDAVTGGAPQQMPGRRYIGMSVQGENEATGFENITAPEGQTLKLIENGQLIIIRGGEKFNAQGQKL